MDQDQAFAKIFNVFATECPSRASFEHIFSRWGLLTLAKLTEKPIRFGALRRAISGISEKMLSQTLQALEAEGLVQRDEWPGLPPHVEYRLTPSGSKISEKVGELIQALYVELGKAMLSKSDLPMEFKNS